MKKILSILLALIFCFGTLISCGNEEYSSSKSESSSEFVEESSSQSQGEETDSEMNSETIPEKEYRSYIFRDVMDIKYDTWLIKGLVRPIIDHCEKTINGRVYSPTTKVDAYLYDGYLKATDYYDAGSGASFIVEQTEDGASIEDAEVYYFNCPVKDKYAERFKESEISISKIAMDFAKEYISDFSIYKLDIDAVQVAVGTNSGLYATKYTFSRKINGYSTTDNLSITVTFGGTIEEFSIGQIGAFDEVEKTVDFEKVEESVKKELEYECYKLDVDMSAVSPQSSRLIKRDDGRIVLAQVFTITVNKPNEEFLQKNMTIITPLDFEPFEINIEK